jgi:signal peptidase I
MVAAYVESKATPESRPAAPVARPRGNDLARKMLGGLWFVLVPALLAWCVVRWLVPPVVLGDNAIARDACRLLEENTLIAGVVFFLIFSAIARYWRFRLPGAGFLSLAPSVVRRFGPASTRAIAEALSLDDSLSNKRTRARLMHVLDSAQTEKLDASLASMRVGFETGDEALVQESVRSARDLSAPVLRRRQTWELVGLIAAVVAALGSATAVRRTVAESYSVLSGSMLPTLEPEDSVVGNRLAYSSLSSARSVRRGDIIVFPTRSVDEGALTGEADFLVKRVIGLPGDRISMRKGVPVINGWMVPVCDAGEYLYVVKGGDNGLHGRLLVEYLDGRAYLTVHALGSAEFHDTYEVQPGEVFVLGDNRNNSSDSRAWNDHHGGGVPIEAIEARAQWFMAGMRGDKRWDLSRLFRPIDSLATSIHAPGIDVRPLEEGIRRCLEKRPTESTPPPPGAPSSAQDANLPQP